MKQREQPQSKNTLLQWIQTTTKIPVVKLEDLSTGIHFCHLLNIFTKGKFSIHKLNKNAKLEHQNLYNLRLLQYGLEEAKISQQIDINLVAKKNFKTILEVLQWWFKLFIKHQITPATPPEHIKIELKKPLRVDQPKPAYLTTKTPHYNNHEEVVQQLIELSKENIPKQTLKIPQNPVSDKENTPPLYPNLEHQPERTPQEPLHSEKKSAYSFGQPQEPEEKTQILHPIKHTQSGVKENIFSNRILPSEVQPINRQNNLLIKPKSLEKLVPITVKSKCKDELHSHSGKESAKSGTPMKRFQKKGQSPHNSATTNLLSMSSKQVRMI